MSPSGATGESHRTTRDAAITGVEVRPLGTHTELDACVDLQRRVWGAGYNDIVPASILKVSQQVGGVAAGAFTEEGEVVGFVYGLTGVRDGHLTHWSHMLGVLSSYRGQGIGQRLKLFQRQWLVDRGVVEMRWTFDPLVSGNAHFNLNLLGVRIHDYVVDMYGDTGSGLHSFGTDRFIAHWDLTRPVDTRSPDGVDGLVWDETPLLNPDSPAEVAVDGSPPAGARIAHPKHIVAVKREDTPAATAWRRARLNN
jgi:predicted GNAT superfamily acetyltransferase